MVGSGAEWEIEIKMIYAEGILYPNDANREELHQLEKYCESSAFDVRNYKSQMEGMPMRIGDNIAGRAIDVYFDKEKNLCVFFQLEWGDLEYYTHLELCYKVSLEGGKIYDAHDFSCCLSTKEHALYKSATFRIVTRDVRKDIRRHFQKNFYLYSYRSKGSSNTVK